MGLLDNLLGSAMPGGAGSTAKPIGMALLGLLAAHALKGRGQPADGSSYDPQGGFLPQRPEDIPPEQQPGLLGSVDSRDSQRAWNVIQGFPLEGGDLERDGSAGVER